MARADTALERDPFEPYRVLNARRRLLLVLLAVATAVTVFWLLLYRPGGVKPAKPPRHARPCVEVAGTRCPGGKADVILLPPAAGAASVGAR